MPNYSTKDILDGLDYRELIALRRRASWCDADWHPSREDMITAMSRSASGAITNGDLTMSGLVQEIKQEVIYRGPHKVDTRIQNILRETAITNVARKSSHPEEFACAHLTGLLQGELGDGFEVVQEKVVQGNKELDIYIQENRTGKEYLIEAKVEKRGIKRLPNQLEGYHNLLDNREKTYIVFFALEERNWKYKSDERHNQLKEFLGEGTIEDLKGIGNDVEIILNMSPP